MEKNNNRHIEDIKDKDEKVVIKKCKEEFKTLNGFYIQNKNGYYYGYALPHLYRFLDEEEGWWPKDSKAFVRVVRNGKGIWYELKDDDLRYRRFLVRKATIENEESYWNTRIAKKEYVGRKLKYKPTARTLKKWKEEVIKNIDQKQNNHTERKYK